MSQFCTYSCEYRKRYQSVRRVPSAPAVVSRRPHLVWQTPLVTKLDKRQNMDSARLIRAVVTAVQRTGSCRSPRLQPATADGPRGGAGSEAAKLAPPAAAAGPAAIPALPSRRGGYQGDGRAAVAPSPPGESEAGAARDRRQRRALHTSRTGQYRTHFKAVRHSGATVAHSETTVR